ncbi:hypothetical protein [Kitasatospora sp. MBT63]|uniref:hypothetical protein n=1 Tax=Kitasatospora sp. MBT63 TaxID=1444768 RepID=UPI0005397F36|nr:hypothetical protein [Kitasatospora sp. MBT63]
MTEQQIDGESSARAAATYLAGLGERLRGDGCVVTSTTWGDHHVVIGSRSDRRIQWFGTKVELFVLAAAVPAVDQAVLAEYTGWAMDYTKHLRSGLPGARNAAMILPALVSGSVQRSATDWAAKDARSLGTTLVGRPVTVQTAPAGAGRVTMYRGRVAWGGMFTGHVLEKASLYFP